MTSQTQREKFLAIYAEKLKLEVRAKPTEYVFPLEKAEHVAELMVAALAKGSGNKESLAIKYTCKVLKIRYTYVAIREYLNGAQS